MSRWSLRSRLPMCAAAVLLYAAAPPTRADVVIIGSLGNFDVHNETEGECNEFDIELEGPHPEDVYHTYHNGNYGAPTITPLPGNTGIRVVYAHPNHATARHAIEHFGVSLRAGNSITAQRFNWVPGGLNPPYPPPPPPPPPPPLAMPRITSEIFYLPTGPMLRETLTNVDTLQRPIWIIRKETGAAREVALEELMVNDPLIQGANQLDLEPERLLFGAPLVFEEDAPPPGELKSEVLVYEVYENRRVFSGGEWHDTPGPIFTTVMSAGVAQGAVCPEQYLPIINVPPQDYVALLDGAAFFSVDAADPFGGEITYQWRHEGLDIPGEHDATLGIDPVTIESAGAYECLVGNACGFTITQAGYLTALSPCSILDQPQPTVACVGGSAVFSVTVQGTQKEYFWRQRGAEIPLNDPHLVTWIAPDGLSSTLTIDNVLPGDAGSYDVMLAGDCDTTVSSVAMLQLDSLGPADMNCDCSVNVLDINAFVLALSSPAGYAAEFPTCPLANGDLDGNGAVDVLDINGFVAALGA
ncbi:Immunoglobulin I-set domain protein [Phycisphaerae bacterium RAS1]|nr:Immunoglobulin I-set domain protein [Phycisphaerae bacterium RAS1]